MQTTRPTLPRAAATLLTALLLLAGLPAAVSAEQRTLSGAELVEAFEQGFTTAHNDARQDRTRWTTRGDEPPVDVIVGSDDLRDNARAWSARMGDGACEPSVLCHNTPPFGPGFSQENCCWSRIGENVAWQGVTGPAPVAFTLDEVEEWTAGLMRGWMDSDGHRRNIMGAHWDDLAVGVHVEVDRRADGLWRTQVWATALFRERSSTPATTRYDTWGDRWFDGIVADRLGDHTDPPAPPTTELPPALTPDTVCAEVSTAFPDLDPASTVGQAAGCLADRAIAFGDTDGRYVPGGTVTRGQMAAFLTRLLRDAGVELQPGGGFTDTDGHTHEDAIALLVGAGITQGVGGGRFDPQGPVTRGQMASFLAATYRTVAGEQLPVGAGGYFRDAAGTHAANVDRLATAGVAQGVSDGRFAPGADVTRGQMALFLTRLYERMALDGVLPEESDEEITDDPPTAED